MRFARVAVAIVLFLGGAVLATGNVWVTAARSTIPLTIDAEVIGKETRHEKHPGFDDVHLLTLSDGRTLQFDTPVFTELSEGEPLSKQAWEYSLEHGGQRTALGWSEDFYGMRWAMSLAMGLLTILTLVTVVRPTTPSSPMPNTSPP